MDIFGLLTMMGGLSLFLFGMSLMGQALEKRAGGKLRGVLEKMTSNPMAGFLTGCAVTAVIQSSSATTVMVVGFVNSGLMTLSQAISVIMGANVGTTVTSWVLSLSGLSGSNLWVQLLKPSSFTPVLALWGIVLYMFSKKEGKKDTGMILLGFSTLMFGMETMTGAVSGLAEVPAFRELFLLFRNPVLGVLAGAVLTAVIQSSSASVGILQALAVTGQVSIGAAVPIIMGQNIGTCVTALLSSAGANKNAKRTAFVHLSFNLIGSAAMLLLFSLWKWVFHPAILNAAATRFGIAVIHTVFNLGCVLLLMPNAGLLEKLAVRIIPDKNTEERVEELDVRLLATPTLALAQCQKVALDMAENAVKAMEEAMECLTGYTDQKADSVRKRENLCDHYEDIIGTYLVNLSSRAMGTEESEEAAALLKMIGDFERISDHAVGVLESAEELRDKGIILTENAIRELEILASAVGETLTLAYGAFTAGDVSLAQKVEPLEAVVDTMKENMRTRHILRMQQGRCGIPAGFVWSDLLTDLERTSDHCSNIAGCIIDRKQHHLNLHETQQAAETGSKAFRELYDSYSRKYRLV